MFNDKPVATSTTGVLMPCLSLAHSCRAISYFNNANAGSEHTIAAVNLAVSVARSLVCRACFDNKWPGFSVLYTNKNGISSSRLDTKEITDYKRSIGCNSISARIAERFDTADGSSRSRVKRGVTLPCTKRGCPRTIGMRLRTVTLMTRGYWNFLHIKPT